MPPPPGTVPSLPFLAAGGFERFRPRPRPRAARPPRGQLRAIVLIKDDDLIVALHPSDMEGASGSVSRPM
eukprot:6882224-Pyramimonas_sp.AAC.1